MIDKGSIQLKKITAGLLLFLAGAFFVLPASNEIVLVNGAWHGAWCWYRVTNILENSGYNVHPVELPGHGIDRNNPGGVDLQDYTNAVVSTLESLSSQAVLAGHSMGGIVISQAAEQLPAKVEKLVYISAFLPADGQTLQELADQDTGSLVPGNMGVNSPRYEIYLTAGRAELISMFYEYSPSMDVNLAETLLRTNPLVPFTQPVSITAENYGNIYKVYVKTAQDRALTPYIQEVMLANTPCDRTFVLDTDHSPFFSKPEELAAIIMEVAGQ